MEPSLSEPLYVFPSFPLQAAEEVARQNLVEGIDKMPSMMASCFAKHTGTVRAYMILNNMDCGQARKCVLDHTFKDAVDPSQLVQCHASREAALLLMDLGDSCVTGEVTDEYKAREQAFFLSHLAVSLKSASIPRIWGASHACACYMCTWCTWRVVAVVVVAASIYRLLGVQNSHTLTQPLH